MTETSDAETMTAFNASIVDEFRGQRRKVGTMNYDVIAREVPSAERLIYNFPVRISSPTFRIGVQFSG
jgi:hypothetical protein